MFSSQYRFNLIDGHHLKMAVLLSLILSLAACGKDDTTETDTTTTIYGTVLDADTGEPVPVAQVSFGEGHLVGGALYGWNAYASTVTGSNGLFELKFSQTEKEDISIGYTILVKKDGYVDFREERSVTIGQGNKYQMDVAIKKR